MRLYTQLCAVQHLSIRSSAERKKIFSPRRRPDASICACSREMRVLRRFVPSAAQYGPPACWRNLLQRCLFFVVEELRSLNSRKRFAPKMAAATVEATAFPASAMAHLGQNLVDGKWVVGDGPVTRKLVNPADIREEVAAVKEASLEQVDAACEAANKAFRSWRCTPAPGASG